MGILKNIFKSKRYNDIKLIAQEIADQEKKSSLIYRSDIGKDKKLVLNKKCIESFVIAVIFFESVIDDKFGQLLKQSTILDEIRKIGKNKDISNFNQLFLNYYNGKPTVDRALNAISQYYIQHVWNIRENITDPVLMTSYNLCLFNIRRTIIEYCQNILKMKKNSSY